MLWTEDNENNSVGIRKAFTALVISSIIGLFSIAVCIFTPSTKEMFAIKILPKIVNNEDLKEIPSIAVKFTKEWINQQLEGLKKEAVKKLGK